MSDDDARIELALERAVEDTLAAGGDARILLAPFPLLRRVFHDDGDVTRLLDAISPPVTSDLDDEQVLERPALLAMVVVRALGATWEEAAVLGAAVITPPAGPGVGGGDDGAYRDDGFGALPASAAAVAELKKAMFRAGGGDAGGDGVAKKGCCCCCGVTGCAICLEEFEDGVEVAEMPCERGHGYHPDRLHQRVVGVQQYVPALPPSPAHLLCG
ncbi:hypothetical protein EJB05_02284, partial [Eragrostis curvula]